MIHDHPNQRKGWAMCTKWNIEYFARIGLVSTYQYYYGKQFGYTVEDYIEHMKEKQYKKYQKKLQKAKDKGQEYFTSILVRKMNYAQRLATY